MYPVRLMLRYRYDTLSAIRLVRCPVLIAHSSGDELVPYAHGRRLLEAAPEPKQFLELKGDHNDGWFETGRAYVAGIDEFLSKSLSLRETSPKASAVSSAERAGRAQPRAKPLRGAALGQ
jgi:hypothetical protein